MEKNIILRIGIIVITVLLIYLIMKVCYLVYYYNIYKNSEPINYKETIVIKNNLSKEKMYDSKNLSFKLPYFFKKYDNKTTKVNEVVYETFFVKDNNDTYKKVLILDSKINDCKTFSIYESNKYDNNQEDYDKYIDKIFKKYHFNNCEDLYSYLTTYDEYKKVNIFTPISEISEHIIFRNYKALMGYNYDSVYPIKGDKTGFLINDKNKTIIIYLFDKDKVNTINFKNDQELSMDEIINLISNIEYKE